MFRAAFTCAPAFPGAGVLPASVLLIGLLLISVGIRVPT
jgi:hypothetical protein